MLVHISVILKHSFRGKHCKSVMNRSRVMKNSMISILCIFHRRHFKNGLGAASLFSHVCKNTSGLKIVKDVIRAISTVEIIGPNRQLSWIFTLLINSNLFVTTLLRSTTPKHIFNDKYHKCMTNATQFMEFFYFEI